MTARIYQPARSAMQSGAAKSRTWVVEFVPDDAKFIDPLMGWTGSRDTTRQVRLSFESKQEAIDYANKAGLPFVVSDPKKRRHILRNTGYGDNFATNRRLPWSH